ncbi:hypothetical protein [Neisseria shayeganii]|uniref:Uncharacterized protein n=1 Tax=Neisseria shayeganii 871 TaxID=1032488 RepID=G4CKI4_9NEIS|nr:hypothetical protein [Neisseria shayeganii]EGY51660.1 hypothetical protein HMPREF9371_2124 [Neisseria shayeganii 871]
MWDAARYTLAVVNHPDAMHYFPDQVREAGNNLARFPRIPEVKSFRWSDYNRGMGSVIVSSQKGEHLPSGDKMGYLTGVLKSLAGAARNAQIPGELLYGSPVGAFGDNQWARPAPYELNTKQELLGSSGGMAVGAFTGRPAIRGRIPGLAGRGSGRTPPAARTPSPVDGEMVFKPQSAPRGAIRAQSYQQNWQQASLEDAIRKFIGSSPSVSFTPSGKAIYQGQGQIRIIHDVGGSYFRIEHTGLTGRRKYLDLDGRVPNNKINSDGSQSGRSQGEYNEATHFRIK